MKPASALLALLLFVSADAWSIEVGAVAPDFELPGMQRTIHLADYRGKAVYLDFWASWCGPCKMSFLWMNEMQAKYGGQGLQIVAVNVDRRTADARTFLNQYPARFDVVFDAAGQTPQSYAIKSMPTSMLIGPDGKVAMVHGGFQDNQRGALEGQIRAMLSIK